MLSEEALVLFAATGACALLILGVLELVTPTRPRHTRLRTAPARDPWRRARTGPVRPVVTPSLPEPAVAEAEPPIERLLLSEAATLPPSAPVVPPLPPPREPPGFEFLSRRPVMPPSPLPRALPERPGIDRPPVAPAAPVEPPVASRTAAVPVESVLPIGATSHVEAASEVETTSDIEAGSDAEAVSEVEAVSRGDVVSEADVVPTVESSEPVGPQIAEIWDQAVRPEKVGPDQADRMADAGPREAEPPVIEPVRFSAIQPAGPPSGGSVVLDSHGDLTAAMAASPGTARPGPSSVVDRCYALYEAKQYAEALGEAVPVLESVAGGTLVLAVRDAARL